MGMNEAVRSFFKRYTDFQGRSRRAEYWWPMLFFFLVYLALIAVITVASALGSLGEIIAMIGGLAYLVFALGVLIPSIAVMVRRLHDLDKSGWWYFIALVPLIGGLLLLYWFCQPGTNGTNTYGDDPKGGHNVDVFS